MTSRKSYSLLGRQLVANRAFVLRRIIAECSVALLARVGGRIPGAAQLAARIDPGAAAPHRSQAARALRRGDTVAALRHRETAERLGRNTSELSILRALRTALARERSAGARPDPTDAGTRALNSDQLAEAARMLS